MIDAKPFFLNMRGSAAPMCSRDSDAGELVRAAQLAIETNAKYISVDEDTVATVWPWLENAGTRIVARFTPISAGVGDDKISDLAARISAAFKQGARGAQIFVRAAHLNAFVDSMRPIRDDLFFNRELCVALDLGECDTNNWGAVFDALGRIEADSVLFTLTKDTGGKSDFVGRIYGMLGTNTLWNGAMHFALGKNLSRIEQVQRLTRAIRPAALAQQIFFINN